VKKNFVFLGLKLVVLLIVDVVAVVAGLVIKSVLGNIVAGDSAQLASTLNIISALVMSVVFFGYSSWTVGRMKLEGLYSGPVAFALKETSVYVVFLVPLAIYGFVGGRVEIFSDVWGWVYAPHGVFSIFGMNLWINSIIYAVLCFVFNAVMYTVNQSKRRKSADTDSEENSDEDPESLSVNDSEDDETAENDD